MMVPVGVKGVKGDERLTSARGGDCGDIICDDANEEDKDEELETANQEEEFGDRGGVAVVWYLHCVFDWGLIVVDCSKEEGYLINTARCIGQASSTRGGIGL